VFDFWDIEKLIPKKKQTLSTFSTKPKTTLITLSSEEDNKQKAETALTMPQNDGSREVFSYETDSGLVRKVSITKFVDKYDFYGNFRKAALVYYDYKTPKCDFVPFYSYMPQYSQLNPQQKSFYFFWRDCVRRGKYIKTDYSYFYLYVYEIINLPDKIPADVGLDMLVTLWKTYRKELPNIDSYMSLWVTDYCLINRLAVPTEALSDFIFDVIAVAEFKEFYLSDIKLMGIDGTSVMLAYLSDYDWRKGKYAGGESRAVYEKHMLGAMSLLMDKLWKNGEIYNAASETVHISRSAFRNSLCTHSVKCKLDVEYVPVSKSETLCRYITAAVRYTENKLRALLGVKSRLAIKDLSEEYRRVIDSYFDGIFARVNRDRVKELQPEYEKLYDAQSEVLSFAGADEIERDSWSTTARLVVDEEEDEIIPVPKNEIVDNKAAENANVETECGLNTLELSFVKAIKDADHGEIKRISAECEMMPDALAEMINEKVLETFGDVIISGMFPEMCLIEDYEEDIEKWLLKIMK